MNIAGYALNNKQVIYFFLFITLLGGFIAYDKLGKREDAPFVIKEAKSLSLLIFCEPSLAVIGSPCLSYIKPYVPPPKT